MEAWVQSPALHVHVWWSMPITQEAELEHEDQKFQVQDTLGHVRLSQKIKMKEEELLGFKQALSKYSPLQFKTISVKTSFS